MTVRTLRLSLGILLVVSVSLAPLGVRSQVTPLKFDQGATGLGLALRQLPVEGTVLYVTAHPDDENNGVLVALNRGRGLKTSLLTVTRGDGGQNEIGPELFQAIGILRGEELAGVHKYDGADQYHTRAYEFGYSFSVEETFEKWGKEEILKDVVRVIRSVRPDVILTMSPDGMGGGQHHQASARLAHEAFRVAADPTRFPEQIKEGLRPWQARKVYQSGGGGPGGGGRGAAPAGGAAPGAVAAPVRVSTGDFDPLLGMSWAQFGQIARGYHQCQGTGQLEAFPGDSGGSYVLRDSEPAITGTEADILQGVDTSIRRLAQFAAGEETKVPSLVADLGAIESAARAALDSFDARAPHKTLPALAQGLARVRQLRAAVSASTLSAGPKAELLWRLDRKAQDFMKALQLAQGLVVHVIANDGNVVRGQSFGVTVQAFNTGPEPMTLDAVTLNVPAGWTAALQNGQPATLAYNQSATFAYSVTVGPNARYSQPFWKVHPGVDRYDLDVPEHQTLPWSPPDVTATLSYTAAGAAASTTSPAYYRYDGPWVGGQKEKVVNIVPVLSVKLTPDIAVVPVMAGGQPREFRVTVANNAKTGASVQVRLETPPGWTVQPASATLTFGVEEEEVTSQFFVTPPAKLQPGVTEIKAVAVRDGQPYREGYQTIAYNHIQERHLFHPASSQVKVFDVDVAAQPADRLRDGHRRRRAAGDSPARRESDDARRRRRRVRRPVAVFDHRARHPRLREAPRRPSLQPAVAGLRAQRRAPRRAIQQGRDEPARRRRRRRGPRFWRRRAGRRPSWRPGRRRPWRSATWRSGGRTSRRGWPGPRWPRRRRAAGQPIRALPGRHYEQSCVRGGGAGSRARRGRRRTDRSQSHYGRRLQRLGPGARPLLLWRQRRALHGSDWPPPTPGPTTPATSAAC